MHFTLKIKTYIRLGIRNLFRIAAYKLLLKLRLHPVQRFKSTVFSGTYFKVSSNREPVDITMLFPLEKLYTGYWPFSDSYISFGSTRPAWHRNYFNGKESVYQGISWWRIPDFDADLGDIKTVWELSRFDWVLQFACWGASGNKQAIEALNGRLDDWMKKNPTYLGVNWKCGQEASIRVMHLLAATQVLRQSDTPGKALLDLLEIHLRRIAPTISYAIGQRNNHGPSEAAALFTGGHFLSVNGRPEFARYASVGRKWLEDRAMSLFDDEGCFSQYSVNYHRLVLDIYSFCESYRKINNIESFSSALYQRLQMATRWLGLLTDEHHGDVPNIGANDGARLFPFFYGEYRDFRFSVQWASLSFFGKPWFVLSEMHSNVFRLVGIPFDRNSPPLDMKLGTIMGNQGGFFIHRDDRVLFIFRRPIFRFRPIQADALHIDLWVDGVNILRDGGSFSYHASPDKLDYYGGARSHNTVLIDALDPMPRISRFLFGAWLKERNFSFKTDDSIIKVASGYTDYLGRSHFREACLTEGFLCVSDWIEGVRQKAILTWRLVPGDWNIEKIEDAAHGRVRIDVKETTVGNPLSFDLGFESRYYMNESPIPVVKYEIPSSGYIETLINWA
jgi:hypothetical protein